MELYLVLSLTSITIGVILSCISIYASPFSRKPHYALAFIITPVVGALVGLCVISWYYLLSGWLS